jgi:phosphoribosyl-ATP pyrophosphohydrolase
VTGNETIFARLMQVIEDRKQRMPEHSYTTQLFQGGTGKIADKLLEETEELIEAANETEGEPRHSMIHEAADLIYHLFVMLAHRDVRLADVEAELARRFGISGLDEKAARSSQRQP